MTTPAGRFLWRTIPAGPRPVYIPRTRRCSACRVQYRPPRHREDPGLCPAYRAKANTTAALVPHPIPAGLYAAVSTPAGTPPEAVMTADELVAAVAGDRLAIGAIVEDLDGARWKIIEVGTGDVRQVRRVVVMEREA